ncbi:SDR family oxidoreductase [Corynebacterium pygosceleis]|uniref:NAD(P)H-binding protein n=1 Tax=Corynebacterium pygosceleis TaxID=2800406 RepID=A0A9Q4C9A7_9CORY|nr:NAD(P)H-binding protein [Corynebacterium pygosceleis]MCK7636427.1 NAD(P)H-binding protein [Corynebacterium pygosceleis]MCK7675000.1 NAD(P)H-binding protein [Corynebacterium pygosceleis]MCL0121411.1 NAD(P)H-binding protein [Corynebacterium pygosceleis]MCX7469259.1 NAD(P)H-binding protein [Corynebacterium pygosceleis]
MSPVSDRPVTVVGATGYLGRYLVAELDARGHRVRAVVRDPGRARQPGPYGAPPLIGAHTELVRADVTEPGRITGLLVGSGRVFSALGVTRQKASPWDVDFLANLAVLREAERTGVESMLYVGAIGMEHGTSLVARSKTAFAAALESSPVPGWIVNPSAYFSDMSSTVDLARRGVLLLPPDPGIRLNPIHGADLAAFCADLSEGPTGPGTGRVEVGGPDVLTAREVVRIAADAAGTDPCTLRIPRRLLDGMVWTAGRVSDRHGNLARFFAESMTRDAVGRCTGTRHLADWFADLT